MEKPRAELQASEQRLQILSAIFFHLYRLNAKEEGLQTQTSFLTGPI